MHTTQSARLLQALIAAVLCAAWSGARAEDSDYPLGYYQQYTGGKSFEQAVGANPNVGDPAVRRTLLSRALLSMDVVEAAPSEKSRQAHLAALKTVKAQLRKIAEMSGSENAVEAQLARSILSRLARASAHSARTISSPNVGPGLGVGAGASTAGEIGSGGSKATVPFEK